LRREARAGGAFAFVVDQRAFQHIGLLEVFVRMPAKVWGKADGLAGKPQ